MVKKDDKTLQMLSTALEMEHRGREFYQKAISQCTNDVGRQIFTMLEGDELIHIKRIMDIFSALDNENKWSEGWKTMTFGHDDMKGFFTDLAKKNGPSITVDTSDIKALEVGIDFESKSVDFYQSNLERATETIEREFVARMVEEERVHLLTLIDAKEYLSDPSAWFRKSERGGIDGA